MTVAPAPRPQSLPPAAPPAAVDAAGAWAPWFGSPTLPSDVSAVAVSGDEVWVGGGFTYGFAGTANDTFLRVAHWDGAGWRRMGAGVDGPVRALAVSGPHVYAGGELSRHLARWDGTGWAPVAGGVSDPDRPYGTTVLALACDGRTLAVGGTFTRAGDVPVGSLAALDLATGVWSDLGGGVAASWSSEPATVGALALHGR